MNINILFLSIPLAWFLLLWIGLVFDISSRSIGIEPIEAGLLGFIWLFLGTPITFIAGTVYTYVKKMWWWFWAYMILGGTPLFIYFGAVFLVKLGFK